MTDLLLYSASMQTILNGSDDGEPAYCRHQQSAFANGNKNLIKNFHFKQLKLIKTLHANLRWHIT